jgi:hypothetical protein
MGEGDCGYRMEAKLHRKGMMEAKSFQERIFHKTKWC